MRDVGGNVQNPCTPQEQGGNNRYIVVKFGEGQLVPEQKVLRLPVEQIEGDSVVPHETVKSSYQSKDYPNWEDSRIYLALPHVGQNSCGYSETIFDDVEEINDLVEHFLMPCCPDILTALHNSDAIEKDCEHKFGFTRQFFAFLKLQNFPFEKRKSHMGVIADRLNSILNRVYHSKQLNSHKY